MYPTPFLGIDFGTSTSCMAWVDPNTGKAEVIHNAEGEERTPSVVYFGESETLVGKAAANLLEDDEQARQRIVWNVKRELANNRPLALAGRRVRPVEVVTAILKKLKADAETLHFHQPVQRVVVTMPAAFDAVEQEKLGEAVRVAGFAEIKLVVEPVAAVLAYVRDSFDAGRQLLIYDLGAGTFNLAVVTQDADGFPLVRDWQELRDCGGYNFDLVLYNYLDKVTQKQIGEPLRHDELDLKILRDCRRWKESLSNQERVTASWYVQGQRVRHVLERSVFEGLIGELVDRTVRLTRTLLEKAKSQRYPVEGVVLIGGSSRVPLVQRQLAAVLPKPLQRWHHQDVAVALGAAYHGWARWGEQSKPILSVLQPPDGSTGWDAYGFYLDCCIEGIVQRLRWIPPGEFLMGSPKSEAGHHENETQHQVILTQGFWLADTACTQALWQAVMSDNPSWFKGEELPVENMSWEDVQKFIERLNRLMPGGGFRLPTEAEWEYACRAGTTTPFWFGETITPDQVNYNGNNPYADGKKGKDRQKTVAVKALPCNGWGLYQMHGNVWEWCQDWFGDYYPSAAVIDPRGPVFVEGAHRVRRGGGYLSDGRGVRSAVREGAPPGHSYSDRGFRLARGQAVR
jgi:formylglycine-generating enzyme required for sulfatase activity/actin-like ATPase involved in cell morphogenesis